MERADRLEGLRISNRTQHLHECIIIGQRLAHAHHDDVAQPARSLDPQVVVILTVFFSQPALKPVHLGDDLTCA